MKGADGRPVHGVILPFVIFTLIWGSTWIVIRDQLGTVPPQWSVTYRFVIAAAAMFAIAAWKRAPLLLERRHWGLVAVVGVFQFCVNFNAVYVAEHFITSGLVATVFALLLIPNSLLAWALLGQRPGARFLLCSTIAIVGIGLLFLQELRRDQASDAAVLAGIGWTLLGIMGASISNVLQATERLKQIAVLTMLAWAMVAGAVADGVLALAVAGPPTFEWTWSYWIGLVYLAVFASALCFSLYFPVVRKIGPGKAAYSSALVPIVAMALSTLFEGYRWTLLSAAGAALAIGGIVLALSSRRPVAAPPPAD
ncbi:MAG: Permease of the drug/metabolite transporter (DMT) superfamily [uncultured Sphingomonas sp.]|uniref:Permease of the drug/metabolite transporter (DMT) superfamily n=1 Tax=uncultured Sphingomonas sp. TaxID=158754 RepID=A0A6J4TIV8_9SPHN|nr:EamA family transporter [uncultured Sphingomonas sp.]CAA9523222.1 MAG: Permease of the drug/metabolite transporter (DMT) superfamily [uncultured Sphingomonas sp.]